MMAARLGLEFRGIRCPITADLLDWLATNLLDMRAEYPDADLNLIHNEYGITLQAHEMRPSIIEQRFSGTKPDEGKGGE